MASALQVLGTLSILHIVVQLFFGFLILCFIVRLILSWLPMLSPANPFVRFFYNVTAPLYDPLYRVLPRANAGVFDISSSIAFLFSWWGLSVLEALILSALPRGW